MDPSESSSPPSQDNQPQPFLPNLTSNFSLDKFHERPSSHSLGSKPSMIEVLDYDNIEGRKQSFSGLSQLDDDPLPKNAIFSVNSFKELDSNLVAQERYQMFQDVKSFAENSLQYSRHQCICTPEFCNHEFCPCLTELDELCMVGLCCQGCIQKKCDSLANQTGKKQRSRLKKPKNPHIQKQKNAHINLIKKTYLEKVQNQEYDFVYCTCKRTQCQKKYCPCFALEKECNQCCTCEDCHNRPEKEEGEDVSKEKVVEIKEEINQEESIEEEAQQEKGEEIVEELSIDNYFEESPQNYDDVEMIRTMEFEPADFTEYRK